MRARAVILAGGEGSRLGVLTEKRAKPAVPFAGKYRIIDFTLSNCVNSGISDVMILTQYRPHSLNEHIASGRPWDLDRGFTGATPPSRLSPLPSHPAAIMMATQSTRPAAVKPFKIESGPFLGFVM